MDIKKGITFVAFGFLLTLVNFNLTINGFTVNIFPDFLGWICIYLAFDKLGTYISDKKYMKWAAMILAVVSCAVWVIDTFMKTIDIKMVNYAVNLVAAVYMFILLGVVIKVARDRGSARADTINILRFINLFVFVILTVLSAVANRMSVDVLVPVVAIVGVIAIVAAIITAVTLFALKKDFDTATIE